LSCFARPATAKFLASERAKKSVIFTRLSLSIGDIDGISLENVHRFSKGGDRK
jgi:hypothetical protein